MPGGARETLTIYRPRLSDHDFPTTTPYARRRLDSAERSYRPDDRVKAPLNVTGSLFPTDLKKEDDSVLVITWSDGRVQRIPYRMLRDRCPCATCREQSENDADQPKPLLPIIDMASSQKLLVDRMEPVGSYAYSILFSDGHNTGVYSFEYLRSLTD